MADTFFAFLDKHLVELGLAAAAFLLYRKMKGSEPSESELEKTAEHDVNARLVPPTAPKPGANGQLDPLEEAAYWKAEKLHRSAQYSLQLYELLRNFVGVNDLHTDTAKILDLAYSVALSRLSFDQLSADYALQGKTLFGFGSRLDLAEDLRAVLSNSQYITFMNRVGMSYEQAGAAVSKIKK